MYLYQSSRLKQSKVQNNESGATQSALAVYDVRDAIFTTVNII